MGDAVSITTTHAGELCIDFGDNDPVRQCFENAQLGYFVERALESIGLIGSRFDIVDYDSKRNILKVSLLTA